MASRKILMLLIAILISVVGLRVDAGIEADALRPEASELAALRSKISALESHIEERAREIKSKEDSITQLESTIQEKLDSISSLHNEMASLQNKGAVHAEELVGNAYARAGELEKQVLKLRNEIEAQSRKRDALEARASEAEKKVQELNLKLESLQKTNDEQKLRIRKTQHALEVAEMELMRAQLESTSKSKKLNEIHGSWLPPWLASHISHFQDLAVSHWNVHAKPVLVVVLQKASEKSTQVKKWAEPHFNTAKTKWVPAVKEHWVILKTNAVPYTHKISVKLVEFYEASRRTIVPHISKVQELAYPYFQEAKKFSKPYIDQVTVIFTPHVEKARIVLKPYTKRVVRVYRRFLKTAAAYHNQIQANVQEKLKRHKLTKPLATKELAWFVASVCLAFPVFFLQRLLSAIFSKKPRKPTRSAHTSHASRRKRRHADK